MTHYDFIDQFIVRNVMKPMYLHTSILVGILLLASCGQVDVTKEVDPFQNLTEKQMVSKAKTAEQRNDFDKAADAFEAVGRYFPTSKYAPVALLNAIYLKAQLTEVTAVESLAQSFLHEYPRDQHADYAYYLYSIAPLLNHGSFLQQKLHSHIGEYGFDVMQKSFRRLRTFVRLYPHSQYQPQVRWMLVYLKHLIAAHHARISQFYLSQGAYQAAINRAMDSLAVSQRRDSALVSLRVMQAAYQKVGLTQQAHQVHLVLKAATVHVKH